MNIADILARKGANLLMIKPTETIGTLARRLQQERVGVMIVSQDGQTIDGIISERDIAYSLADRKGDLPLVFVSALMTRKVVTCSPEDSLSRAAALMHQHRIRHLPVVHEGQLKGLVSMRDILASRVDELEKKSSMALNLVSSAE